MPLLITDLANFRLEKSLQMNEVNSGLYAVNDVVIPGNSIKEISALAKDYQTLEKVTRMKNFEWSKELKVQLQLHTQNGKIDIWIANSSSQPQIIPAGMCIAEMTDIEDGLGLPKHTTGSEGNTSGLAYTAVSDCYVSHCRKCQRRKSQPQRPPGLLHPILPGDIPFTKTGIDLLGRFPLTKQGNRWIVVFTDYHTRFTVTKALPSGEASEIAKFLVEDVILKHGSPREIIIDRGRSFLSNLVKEVNNLCMTYHLLTTAYHPQTNGLTERFNKTLAETCWPYAILPFLPDESANDYVQNLMMNVEEARQLAKIHLTRAQTKTNAVMMKDIGQ
ncbi:transposon Ty3-I Gag-Pol polyprotein [Trichonephila inaurata madagascariensis]|uniref:Transposon Ty3-I Gag-Pol polyprotein n=1 Tax=Trichonephila inaurata madagascariensis TaxID=2747483 RepID=A0A8X6YVH8_9ARAC|nr:transposon Ty3-I Gag-Pol polyprotein [Trichonephila inaurata madagascariensis]